MPPRGRGCARTTLVLVALTLACGLIAGLALVGLSLSQGLPMLGEPSPSLDTLARGGLSAYLLLHAGELNEPAGEPEAELELTVEQGASASQVVEQLVAARVVQNGPLLLRYLRYRGIDISIQAGTYELSGDMSLRRLAEALQLAGAPSAVLTVPEGYRREQVSELVESLELDYGGEAFLQATSAWPAGGPPGLELPAGAALEGFLFPDTYQVNPQGSPEELVVAMLANFAERVEPGLRSRFTDHGLTLHQAVTLASIVEREAVLPAERPLIAAVFLNRLQRGMPLEADPTVQYALGRQPEGGWWKRSLSALDLAIDSPFNTYRNPGLPPAPIANPGLSSLQAVAEPADTELLYFRAACDGSGAHLFAGTFGEHLQNACP
ncbi:MAG TPA: endolytic transglycosylase MltG [Anaerolineales bacterium]